MFGSWEVSQIHLYVCCTGAINHEMASGRNVPWCDSLPGLRGWQRRGVWVDGGRLICLAAVLIFSQQPSYVLSVIEVGNISLCESFPAASQSAHAVLLKN